MPRRIHLHPYVSKHNLQERYRHVHTSVEHSRWQFLWLLTHGLTAMAIARVTGYSTVLADGGANGSAKQSDERANPHREDAQYQSKATNREQKWRRAIGDC
jgi:hypothetical protein